MESILHNIERTYESLNIYNAILFYETWGHLETELYTKLKKAGYPVMKWKPDKLYMMKARLLFVKYTDFEYLSKDITNFNVALTVDDALFDKCLMNILCRNMIILRI